MAMHHIKRAKHKIGRGVLTRTFFFVVILLLQIALLIGLTLALDKYSGIAYIVLMMLSGAAVIALLDRDGINPVYKLMWILIILMLPPMGVIFYLFWGHRNTSNRHAQRLNAIEQRITRTLPQEPEPMHRLEVQDSGLARSATYLSKNAGAPLYADTKSQFFPWGEDFFPCFLAELKKAQRFIFMEYFIIKPGYMWDTTLAVLKEKAAAGVDVRILYDSFGCMFTLPEDYYEQLRGWGIKCYPVFPPRFSTHISDYTMLNHRDHRKITAIDGNVAFTGGLTFSDEYINRKKRFGVWKDTGLMLKGSGAYSLTCLFLEMWDFVSGEHSEPTDFAPTLRFSDDGLVQPYGDSPLDDENVAENAYFNILQQSTDYVYIATPYLVVDNEMITTLSLIAKSGVDVRIITPGIPDKWYVYWVTQSYYPILLRAGVRIYEYTPGFIHAKMYVSDDKTAVVGSANMDYRSLYLHFENCCCFYGGKMVKDVKEDLESCMAVSHEVTLEDVQKTPFFKRLFQIFLRLFAPLL